MYMYVYYCSTNNLRYIKKSSARVARIRLCARRIDFEQHTCTDKEKNYDDNESGVLITCYRNDEPEQEGAY